MLIDANHASFEDAVIAFHGVGADGHAGLVIAVGVFLAAVVHYVVLGELLAKALVAARLVGHQVAFARDVLANDWRNLFLGRGLDMEATGASAALDKGQHGVLVVRPAALHFDAFLAADEGLIDLNNLSAAAHGRKGTVAHGFANAVSKEPSGFHAARKHPLDLIGRNALLAGAHQVNDLKPKV